ncbi:MAG: hypothetical protein JW797_04795 [Bradymonadales bacterium]|nr:hypothetical protein [Bradymonadales bacterium]
MGPSGSAPFNPEATGEFGPEGPGGKRTKARRRVVVGGAAVASAEAMTQALDIDVFKRMEGYEPVKNEGSPPSLPAVGAPMAGPVQMPGQVIIGAGAPVGDQAAYGARSSVIIPSATPTSQEPVVEAGSRRWMPIALIGGMVAVVAAIVAIIVALATRGEDQPEPTTPEQPAQSAMLAGTVRIDTLLQRMRSNIDPFLVAPALNPEGAGVALGIRGTSGGISQHWLATPAAPDPAPVSGDLVQAVSGLGDATVFVMFDQATDLRTAITTLEQLRNAGASTAIVGGSHLGPDVYFAFRTDGTTDAPVTITVLNRVVQVWHSSWQQPANLCYLSAFPAERLRDLLNVALADVPQPWHVRLELPESLPLQTLFQAASATHRDDIHLYLALTADLPIPEECSQ